MYKEVTGDPIAMEPTKEEYIIPNTNLDTLKREVCTGKYQKNLRDFGDQRIIVVILI